MKVCLKLAALALAMVAMFGGRAQAALTWYDGFVIDDANPGSATTYVSTGALGSNPGDAGATPPVPPYAGQDGGSGTFFTSAPWVQSGGDTNVLATGSLTRQGQSIPSTGDKVSDEPATGCCNTARTGHSFAAPLQTMNGTVYMSFLVNFGLGNPADPHYRAVEFWDGGIGDGFLNMSIGVSSFGNYNDAVNDADGPGGVTANRQLSVRVDGVRELLGTSVQQNYQLGEHLEWADNKQFGQTHEVVIKFDLTTNDVEIGGPGDTVSFFLNPKLTDVVEPTPSLVVAGVDLNLDRMSSFVSFNFTGANPANPCGFDELRVGTTWADVAILSVPEPASLSLVGLGAIGLLMGARRKRS